MGRYLTAGEAGARWGVSRRRIAELCAKSRIPGAILAGGAWLIPEGAAKPADPRKAGGTPRPTLAEDLAVINERTLLPMPHANADSILDEMESERLRFPYRIEIAYLRGEFEKAIRLYRDIGEDDAIKLRVSGTVIAAAACTGEFALFTEIDAFIGRILASGFEEEVCALAELARNVAYASASVPGMVSEWLRRGDFDALPLRAKIIGAQLRASYLHAVGRYEAMHEVARAALSMCDTRRGVANNEIFLRVACASALYALDRRGEAERELDRALRIALPHGFFTPFAESIVSFGGLLERLLLRDNPSWYEPIVGQITRTGNQWIAFHNRIAQASIPSMMSIRESEIALLAARRVPYKDIAERYGTTAGSIRNAIQAIYGKLYVNNREELARLILYTRSVATDGM